jgi:hypothetical protein
VLVVDIIRVQFATRVSNTVANARTGNSGRSASEAGQRSAAVATDYSAFHASPLAFARGRPEVRLATKALPLKRVLASNSPVPGECRVSDTVANDRTGVRAGPQRGRRPERRARTARPTEKFSPEMVACKQTFVPCDILSNREDLQLLNRHLFGFVAGRGN